MTSDILPCWAAIGMYAALPLSGIVLAWIVWRTTRRDERRRTEGN